LNIPETASEIKRASREQLARSLEQAAHDRDDPYLVAHPGKEGIQSALDVLAERLHDLDVLIARDLNETHP